MCLAWSFHQCMCALNTSRYCCSRNCEEIVEIFQTAQLSKRTLGERGKSYRWRHLYSTRKRFAAAKTRMKQTAEEWRGKKLRMQFSAIIWWHNRGWVFSEEELSPYFQDDAYLFWQRTNPCFMIDSFRGHSFFEWNQNWFESLSHYQDCNKFAKANVSQVVRFRKMTNWFSISYLLS